jgi:hypothetical protein
VFSSRKVNGSTEASTKRISIRNERSQQDLDTGKFEIHKKPSRKTNKENKERKEKKRKEK